MPMAKTHRSQQPRPPQHPPSNQWPLRAEGDAQPGAINPSLHPSQRVQPRRPPRPNNPPTMLVPPRPAGNRGQPVTQSIPQYHQDNGPPIRQYAQQEPVSSWVEDVSPYPSPDVPRPFAETQRDSSGSSVYSLPDFPIPQAPIAPQAPQIPQQVARPRNQANRRPPLGPPPSARRGPASYYPQSSYVTPIVEETDSQRALHESKSSFASSNAIPIGISRHLANQHDVRLETESPFEDHFEDSDSSDGEQMRPIPVRQASIGRKSVPTLTTIKNSDVRPDSQTRPLGYPNGHESNGSAFDAHSLRRAEAPENVEPELPEMSFPMVDMSPEEHSEKSIPQLSTRTTSSDILVRGATVAKAPAMDEKSMKRQPSRELLSAGSDTIPTATSNRATESTAEDSEKVGAPNAEKQTTLAQRVGSRRPPRINVDVVREAEARGSLTSLPDLIRRATKVASNLDRGRTASRLGLNFFDEDPQKANGDNRRSNSLSDILASFPPPGLATPPGSRGSRGSRAMPWPSHLRHSTLPSESDLGEVPEKKRRCCGMPLWLFLTLLLLIILLVAAAIIIPIVLVVIPKQNGAHVSGSASALASCQKSLSCHNGGSNIVGSDGSCSCLCVNGFAGSKCTESSSASCTTTNVGSVKNVTLGDSIPRLFTQAQNNFSIPLNASNILGLFSSSGLTCTTENALVTFNSLSARSVEEYNLEKVTPTLTKPLQERADSTTAAGAAVTSNGIVFASGSASDTSSSSSSSDTTTKSPSVSSSTSNSTSLDFARVAVLLVLQESAQLSDAVTAQENLQSYFTSGTTSTGQAIDASDVDLGTSISANFEKYSITLSNGTVLGG